MLLLTSTSDLLQVVTGSAVTTDVHASWVDNASGTITPGRTNTAITGAATTTVVASPASGTQRNVQTLNIRNRHATSSVVITVQHTDGTTTAELIQYTLLAGEMLQYVDSGGWRILNASGQVKTEPTGASVTSTELSAVSAAAASAISIVSQAVSIVSNAASNALSVANAASNAASVVSTAASNALSVANAASNAASIVSQALSSQAAGLSVRIDTQSQAISVVSNAASNALSVANAASNAASIVSQALSNEISNRTSADNVLSNAISAVSQQLSLQVSAMSQALSTQSIGEHAGVSLSGTPTSLQALAWRSVSAQWINASVGGGGAGSVTSNELSAVSAAAASAISIVSNAVSIVSVNAASALSIANAASNAASIVSVAVSAEISNRISADNALSNAISAVSAQLSVQVSALSQRISEHSLAISVFSQLFSTLRGGSAGAVLQKSGAGDFAWVWSTVAAGAGSVTSAELQSAKNSVSAAVDVVSNAVSIVSVAHASLVSDVSRISLNVSALSVGLASASLAISTFSQLFSTLRGGSAGAVLQKSGAGDFAWVWSTIAAGAGSVTSAELQSAKNSVSADLATLSLAVSVLSNTISVMSAAKLTRAQYRIISDAAGVTVSATTQTPIAGLSLSLAAGAIYEIEVFMKYSLAGSAASGMRVMLSLPALASGGGAGIAFRTSAGAGGPGVHQGWQGVSTTLTVSVGAGVVNVVQYIGMVNVSAAGTLQAQVAVSAGGNVIFSRGSYAKAFRID